ncbi:MAG: histidine phosphatase family protein [Campylobacterales bacterium]|nr:histidine phosphatase family protein [Campylobacterales bacterium]
MKRLCLIRHAKSSWSNMSLADFDRPLNARGKKDALLMGKEIAQHIKPDLVISSSAKRTKETTALLLQSFNNDIKVIYEDRLYEASMYGMADVITEVDESVVNLFLVAHNPGIHMLIEYLSGKHLAKMPTCATAFLKTDISTWSELKADSMELERFIYPKMFQ